MPTSQDLLKQALDHKKRWQQLRNARAREHTWATSRSPFRWLSHYATLLVGIVGGAAFLAAMGALFLAPLFQIYVSPFVVTWDRPYLVSFLVCLLPSFWFSTKAMLQEHRRKLRLVARARGEPVAEFDEEAELARQERELQRRLERLRPPKKGTLRYRLHRLGDGLGLVVLGLFLSFIIGYPIGLLLSELVRLLLM
jgi:hypothetical protein